MDKRHLVMASRNIDGTPTFEWIEHDEWIARLDAAYAALGFKGIIELTSGTYDTDLWASAMVALYGPPGIHDAYLNPDGTPNEVGLAFPEVSRRMALSRDRLSHILRRPIG